MRVVRGSVVVALVVALVIAPSAAATAEDYPTWDEVEAAKAQVGASEAEASRIDAFVDELESESGRLGDAAVAAAGASVLAEQARADAAARATALADQASEAEAEATAATAALGRAGAVLARTGGADLGLRLLLDGDASARLLMGLSRAAQLTTVIGGVASRARSAEADAAAVRDQADRAESERTRLAAEAVEAAAAAEAAHVAAQERVAEQQAALDTLYAQLASLRDRSVEVERQFRIGEQEARDRAAREAAAAAAAEAAGGFTAAPPPGVTVDRTAAQAYAASAVARYGWDDGQYQCLYRLWMRESSWRADAYNASSGAYGIPQSLPGSKMAAAGADWRTNANTQIEWGLSYISSRYGSPCAAWAHSEAVNWY
ncbi:lytic transglycosylase domain-containing protein [Agromyces aureus]|uniref:aggregation-promoting factor C-terminal-like domain-containing protein n=2 Tax=Agromyces aureus TaxID=453304 RepID=UPI0008373A8A|nr:lytic transglycosylase domain-containing protein [Agromyces aureus]